MRYKKFLFVIFSGLILLMNCESGPREPREYVHASKGFKITMPGNWQKESEDGDMFEFRWGSLRLVEVGGFDLPVEKEDLFDLDEDEFRALLMESTLQGLDGYCEEAKIQNFVIKEQYETIWSDEMAYRVQVSGYSNEALTTVVVDMLAIVKREQGRMYMFASQIEEKAYSELKMSIEGMIQSFKILDET